MAEWLKRLNDEAQAEKLAGELDELERARDELRALIPDEAGAAGFDVEVTDAD